MAENTVIGEDARVGTPPPSSGEEADEWGIAVVAQNLKVGAGAVVPANAMVTRNVKGGAK